MPGPEVGHAVLLLDARRVCIGRAECCCAVEKIEVDVAIARDAEGRCLELGLLREEENERARLAGICGWNVEIED